MKSYKNAILASLASSLVLSFMSLEVQAQEPTEDLQADSQVQVVSQESPEALAGQAETGEVIEETAPSQPSVTEETYAANEARANDPAYSKEVITANDGVNFTETGEIESVTIGGETAPVTKQNPAQAEAPVNNTPNRITTNVSKDPATSMMVQWHTTDPDPEARLYVWEDQQDISQAQVIKPEVKAIEDAFHIQTTPQGHYVYAIIWDQEAGEAFTSDKDPWIAVDNPDLVDGYYTDEHFSADNLQWLDKGFDNYSLALPYPAFTETAYKATVTDLKPNTLYHYQVGNLAGLMSEKSRFRTASKDKSDFSFFHYTDTQNAYSSEHQRSEAAYSASTVQSMLNHPEADQVAFALHSGDIVNDDWNDTEWSLTLDALLPLNNVMPHLYVTGNHDNENFLDHIHTPNEVEGMTSGAAYSTRYNGVQFIVLNTEQDNESDAKNAPAILENQMAWFEGELKEANRARANGEIDWIIVSYHRPLFSSSYHSLEDENVQLIRDDLMKLLDDYDVDLVLNGHDHNLTVTHALKHDGQAFGNAKVATPGITQDNTTLFENPEGTVFIIPSTAGTKTYDAIYKNQSFDWILEEEDIDETYRDLFGYEFSQADVDYFRSLLHTEDQPFKSSYYQGGHSNAREGNIQHYGLVKVTGDSLTYYLYEVIGEDLSNRETNLLHVYTITKNKLAEDLPVSADLTGSKPLADKQGQATMQTADVAAGRTSQAEVLSKDENQDQAGQKANFTAVKSVSDQAKAGQKDSADPASLPKTGLSNLALYGLSSIFLGLGLTKKKRKF